MDNKLTKLEIRYKSKGQRDKRRPEDVYEAEIGFSLIRGGQKKMI
jgi:hypothetical protein